MRHNRKSIPCIPDQQMPCYKDDSNDLKTYKDVVEAYIRTYRTDAARQSNFFRGCKTFDEAIEQANRLPFGLAAYAFTENARQANLVADALDTGMVGLNSFAISVPDAPFGGVKESGFGSEGGPEGLDSYYVTKAVHQY